MRIVIIDDHPVVRNGLEQTIALEQDLEIVGSAASYEEGLELIITQQPDLAIVDLKMPDGNGLDLVSHSKRINSHCRHLILTAHGSPHEVSRIVSEEVDGYILKEALPEEIINAVRLVGKGRRYFDPQAIQLLLEKDRESPVDALTAREKEILQAVAAGLNNGAIAEKFYISEKTVKKHVSNIMAKLGTKDRVQLALYVAKTV